MSENKRFFGDNHKMAHIWARKQAFDQIFKIHTVQPAASTMQKTNPVPGFNLLSLKVCLYTFISCYLKKKIIRIGFRSFFSGK